VKTRAPQSSFLTPHSLVLSISGPLAGPEPRRAARRLFQITLILSLLTTACGYHIAGRGDALPKSIHVIAIPTMENRTTTYRIEQKLTQATIHEFLTSTSYKIVSNPNDGDAVLQGKVALLEAVPLLFDTATGRATTMLVTIRCEFTLTDKTTQKVLYQTRNFTFRSEYEISTDIQSFFNEQDPALDRLSNDFARRVVAAVTENF
jgi:outer membrane lipopolysaccharide assembly protein LptE/RlpB